MVVGSICLSTLAASRTSEVLLEGKEGAGEGEGESEGQGESNIVESRI